jgi:hypothetical protein
MANGNGNGDGRRRWQQQWLTVMTTAMVDGDGNKDGRRRWVTATGMATATEMAMAFAMAIATARATMTKGGLPHHVQFTEQPSVCPLYYSGAQEPCQPIDALPPPLLFHIFAKVSLGGAWIVCLRHAALWHG